MTSYLASLPPSRRAALLRLGGGDGGSAPAPLAPTGTACQLSQPQVLELARLRASVRSQAAESDSLRRNLQELVAQNKQLDHVLQTLRHTSQVRERRAEERHAAERAELEEQQRRQRRALLDLAGAAEALAKENADLHARLLTLQDEHEDSRSNQDALRERLSRLQAVCLHLEGQQEQQQQPQQRCQQQAELLAERLSATLRALGPANGLEAAALPGPMLPEPLVPGKVKAATRGLPTDLRVALREMEALRREREGLAARLKSTEAQALALTEEKRELHLALARERHNAGAATADLQRQLKAARDRVESMAKRCREKDAVLAERDAFVAKLERRLLQRSPQLAAAGCRAAGGKAAAGCVGSGVGSRAGGEEGSRAGERRVAEAGLQEWPDSPVSQSLAALSPGPESPWQPVSLQLQQQRYPVPQESEFDLEQLLGPADGTAGAGFGDVWAQEFACGIVSPGVDSTIPAETPEQDLAPRRLSWAPGIGPAEPQQAMQEQPLQQPPLQPPQQQQQFLQEQQQQEQQQQALQPQQQQQVLHDYQAWREMEALQQVRHEQQSLQQVLQQLQQGDEEGWAAYQLGSPSPCGVGGSPDGLPAQPAQQRDSWQPEGGMTDDVSNPLFSFHAAQASPELEEGPAAPRMRGLTHRSSLFQNELFSLAVQLQQHEQQLEEQQQQPHQQPQQEGLQPPPLPPPQLQQHAHHVPPQHQEQQLPRQQAQEQHQLSRQQEQEQEQQTLGEEPRRQQQQEAQPVLGSPASGLARAPPHVPQVGVRPGSASRIPYPPPRSAGKSPAAAAAAPASPQLPVSMPSGEFPSVAALLQALTPGAAHSPGRGGSGGQATPGGGTRFGLTRATSSPSARAGTGGTGLGLPRASSSPPAGPSIGGTVLAGTDDTPLARTGTAAAVAQTPPAESLPAAAPAEACATNDAVERKLQAAVATFFAESAEKVPSMRSTRHSADVAPAWTPGLAKPRLQRTSAPAGAGRTVRPGAAPPPPMKHGRLNRAADQQALQRRTSVCSSSRRSS